MFCQSEEGVAVLSEYIAIQSEVGKEVRREWLYNQKRECECGGSSYPIRTKEGSAERE